MGETDKDARQRILDASIALFSKKGYAGAGVREIAAEAHVNLAMISYYFNGKIGILKEIIDYFFNLYLPIFKNVDDPEKSPEACFRQLVYNLVQFIRQNTELFLLIYNELPLDVPEVAELKSRRIQELLKIVSGLLIRLGLNPENRIQVAIIAPSLISATVAQFRLRPVMKQVYQIEPNDRYYEKYVDTICTLFLNGVSGLK